jgi:hypothetical protein
METVSARDVEQMLRRYLHSRSDIGLWNAIGATILKQQNPFEPRSVRKPQQWLVLSLIIATALAGAFLFFSLSK